MSALIRSMTTPARRTRLRAAPVEVARYRCEDESGNRYCLVVSRLYPGLSVTGYALDDGSPVNYIDDCRFEIDATGVVITRCP